MISLKLKSSPVNNMELIYPLSGLYKVWWEIFLPQPFKGSDTSACPLFISAFCSLLMFAVILNLCG